VSEITATRTAGQRAGEPATEKGRDVSVVSRPGFVTALRTIEIVYRPGCTASLNAIGCSL